MMDQYYRVPATLRRGTPPRSQHRKQSPPAIDGRREIDHMKPLRLNIGQVAVLCACGRALHGFDVLRSDGL